MSSRSSVILSDIREGIHTGEDAQVDLSPAPSRVIDSMKSDDTGQLLYNLHVTPPVWSYDSPRQTLSLDATASGVYSFLYQFTLFRFFVALLYYYNILDGRRRLPEGKSQTPDVEWRMAVSPSFTQIAILQTDRLLVKSIDVNNEGPSRLDLGSFVVPMEELNQFQRDFLHPEPEKYRQVAWSIDEQVVGVLGGSTGSVFIVNVLEEMITHVIEPQEFGITTSVTAITFRDSGKGQQQGWELLILSQDGFLLRLRVPYDGQPITQIGKEEGSSRILYAGKLHTTTLCMTYDRVSDLLVIGGGARKLSQATLAKGHSISAWKLTNAAPYHELVFSSTPGAKKASNFQKGRSFLRTLKFIYRSVRLNSAVLRVSMSADGTRCATLNSEGGVAVWNLGTLEEAPMLLTSKELVSNFQSSQSDSARILAATNTVVDIGWWSPEALVVLWSNGDLSVHSIENSSNILGRYAERFESNSQLSVVAELNRFYVLETKKKEIRMEREDHPHALIVDDESDASPLDTQLSSAMGEAIDFLSEKKESASSEGEDRYRYFYRNTTRLVEFDAVTPLEFIRKKVSDNQLDDALAMARFYNISLDLVYQYRWQLAQEITVSTIRAALEPIENRTWVLEQCLHHVGRTLHETALLYVYGLYQTVPAEWYSKPFADWTEADLADLEEVMKLVVIPVLPGDALPEGTQVLFYYRLLLLHYLDRLYVYEAFLRSGQEEIMDGLALLGVSQIGGQFNSEQFMEFKDTPLADEASQLARLDRIVALTRCFCLSPELSARRLSVLNQIPTTTDPEEYRDILPALEEESRITWRSLDWTELLEHRASCETAMETSVEELTHLQRLEILSSKPVIITYQDAEVLESWYMKRARTIDQESGFSSYAEYLLQVGREALPDDDVLAQFHEKFRIYTNMIYESDSFVSWTEFQNYDRYDILKRLLDNSTQRTIASDVHRRCSLLIQQSNKELENIAIDADTDVEKWILVRHLLKLASSNRLSWVAPVLNSLVDPSQPDLNASTALIPSEKLFLRTALQCVYATSSTDQWESMNAIYQSLPERDPHNTDPYYQRLHDQVDQFDVHLQASELLSHYNISLPLNNFRNLNSNSARQLIQKICAQAGKAAGSLTDKEWLEILSVILDLREKVFEFISIDFCYSCFCEALLFQGKFQLAKEYLVKSAKAPSILIKVAKEFFNSSANANDENFANAETCLTLIASVQETPKGQEELNLLEATRILHQKFDYKKVPIQIRLADKNELIRDLIAHNPKAYRHSKSLLEVLHLFDPEGKSKKKDNQILCEAANMAYLKEDYKIAHRLCDNLMSRDCSASWDVALKLGFAPSNPVLSHDVRVDMLQFALCYCPPEKIHLVLARINHLRCIDHVLGETDQESFDQLLSSPVETHEQLKLKMSELAGVVDEHHSKSLDYLDLDSLFATTLYDYHILHSHVVPLMSHAHDKSHVDGLLWSSLNAFHAAQLQSAFSYLYQAVMFDKFLPQVDKFLRHEVLGMSDDRSSREQTEGGEDAAEPIVFDKDMTLYVKMICYALSARYLLSENTIDSQGFLNEHNLEDVLKLAMESTDDGNPYAKLLDFYHSLLEQPESTIFHEEVVPNSFKSLEQLAEFYRLLLSKAENGEDIVELHQILEKWIKSPPLPQRIPQSYEGEGTLFHELWRDLVVQSVNIGDAMGATRLFMSDARVHLSQEDEKFIINAYVEAEKNSSLSPLFRFKTMLFSRHEDLRQEGLNQLAENLEKERQGEKALVVCDPDMARVFILERSDQWVNYLRAPSFFFASVQMVKSNTVWDTSVPSLCGLAYPKDGHAILSLPYLVGTLVKMELVENAAQVVCEALHLPVAFSGWSNAMFVLCKFLENQKAEHWTENARSVIIPQTFVESNFWQHCVELVKEAISLLPGVHL